MLKNVITVELSAIAVLPSAQVPTMPLLPATSGTLKAAPSAGMLSVKMLFNNVTVIPGEPLKLEAPASPLVSRSVVKVKALVTGFQV